jgi:NADH dehydrogenase
MPAEVHAVTGAFGYTGKYIAHELLDAGKEVITLTNSAGRENPFGGRVKAFPYDFENPEKLADTLKGVSVLYNTYWVRFSHSQAIKNSLILFDAAKRAGVKRIVHVSIANPSIDSKLSYYSGKAILEKTLMDSGVPYSIVRPAVLFGKEGILINNIAWMIRHLPVMGIFGDGKYKMSPIHVEDLARVIVSQGAAQGNAVIDAAGPETYEYRELVGTLSRVTGKKPLVLNVPPVFGLLAAFALGVLMNDKVLTQDEITGLVTNLLCIDAKPVGTTKLSDWAAQNRTELGVKYMSELARRRDKKSGYNRL